MEIRTGDWKGEKHVPVIEVLENKEGKARVEVSVGKEIPHPNTPEHHIAWIELYFQPEDGQFPIMVGRADFASHAGPITEPKAVFEFACEKKGKLMALSYCNIHGLWESEMDLQ
jgi:superoxide reductase